MSARLASALTRRTSVAALALPSRAVAAGPSTLSWRSSSSSPAPPAPSASAPLASDPATVAASAAAAPAATQAGPSHPPSSTPAGTPIPEVVIYVNQQPPLAMEDAEYPSWLWNLIGDGRAANKASLGAQDEGRGKQWGENQTKRVVRKTNREAIKTSNLLKSS